MKLINYMVSVDGKEWTPERATGISQRFGAALLRHLQRELKTEDVPRIGEIIIEVTADTGHLIRARYIGK
jgi:hypothetical protein